MQIINTNFPEISAYPGEYNPILNHYEIPEDGPSKLQEEASIPFEKIIETPEYYKVEFTAHGFEREDFFVNIDEKGYLSISAKHKEQGRIENEKYPGYISEDECFNRKFLLPENIDTDFFKAEFRAGVLSFWFLKTEKPCQRKTLIIVVY